MGNIKGKPESDPDTAWKAQNREQKDNPLYQFVNLKQTGLLVDTYERRGPAACAQIVRERVEPMLLNAGRGGTINKVEWIRFQAKCNARLKGTTLDVIDNTDDSRLEIEYGEVEQTFTPFAEHEACWRLDMRGSMGETALHLLCLQNSPVHVEIAKILLKMYPKMALDIYEGDEYYGETALHLAISNGDQTLVRLLVENGADVNQRATGRFFLPEDQKRKKKAKVTNYAGYAYFGEYPLSFAACFGHEEIYDYLIDHGADPNAQDSFGNTVLHVLVVNDKVSMMNYAVKHHSQRATIDIENNATLTPLGLAAMLGRNAVFKDLLELQAFEVWRYSNIGCSCYPLAPLDTIGIGGATNWRSVLIYMTDGKTDDHLEMLEGGVIKQLLDEKWKTFAYRRFIERFAQTILYIAILTTAIYLRPPDNLLGPTDPKNIVRYIMEILVVLYVFINLCLQIDEMRLQGVIVFLKNQLQAPAKLVFNLSCILIMLAIPFRFTRDERVENVLIALACPMSWFFTLFFLRGHGVFGPFVIMIYQMTASDIVRFFIIFTIFLAQFTQGFYFLFNGAGSSVFSDEISTLLTLYQMTFGEFKYDELDVARQPQLIRVLFVFFALLVPILLLNMLIAMMGNTYNQVISRSEKEWKRQWAKIIIVLERSYSRTKLLKFQEEYSVPAIGGSSPDERGLMVIKTSKKTKARRRKGAIANWKRMVKDVKMLLKEAKKQGKVLNLHSKDVLEMPAFIAQRPGGQHGMPGQPGAPVQPGVGIIDDGGSADGLISAMTQLAWERDIDLTRGPAAFTNMDSNQPIQEVPPPGNNNNSNNKQPPGGGNPNNEQRPSSGNGSARPHRMRSAKVAPGDGTHSSTPQTGSSRESSGSGGKGSKTPRSAKGQRSGKSRPESEAEKDDRDQKVFSISGQFSSTNSLSSLINNAWETKTDTTNV